MTHENVGIEFTAHIQKYPSDTVYLLPPYTLTLEKLVIKKPIIIKGQPESRLIVKKGIDIQTSEITEKVLFEQCDIRFEGERKEAGKTLVRSVPYLISIDSFANAEF